MSLQTGLVTIEPHLRKKNKEGKPKKSSKWYKKFRNKWIRRFKKEEYPPTKFRRDWEY